MNEKREESSFFVLPILPTLPPGRSWVRTFAAAADDDDDDDDDDEDDKVMGIR
jgi:hypothetical protein